MNAQATQRRISGRPGWSARKRGPNGRRLCRECLQEVAPRRFSYCSDPCAEAFRLRTDHGYIRQLLEQRDRGICALCGLDCIVRWRELRAEALAARNFYVAWREIEVRLGIPSTRETLWDADHITPVADGGADLGLNNYRTLCLWCHRKVTAQWQRQRAEQRKEHNRTQREQPNSRRRLATVKRAS